MVKILIKKPSFLRRIPLFILIPSCLISIAIMFITVASIVFFTLFFIFRNSGTDDSAQYPEESEEQKQVIYVSITEAKVNGYSDEFNTLYLKVKFENPNDQYIDLDWVDVYVESESLEKYFDKKSSTGFTIPANSVIENEFAFGFDIDDNPERLIVVPGDGFETSETTIQNVSYDLTHCLDIFEY